MNGERAGRTVRQKNSDNKHPLASTQKSAIPHDSRSPAVAIITLQQTFGNQQVQRWFKSGLLQAKLQIGQPNDIYEQEADRVADQVMRMPDEKVDSRQSIVRRRGEVGGLKGESLQMKPG